MSPQMNLVPWRPPGLVVAVQYWRGDESAALRLARLIADIEPEYRPDMTLVLSRRFDVEVSAELRETVAHCNAKMVTFPSWAPTKGEGHPDGANALWDGTMFALAERWAGGDLNYPWVFTVEADGCPVAHDWAIRLMREQGRAVLEGKHVTGPLMRLPYAHVNGTMVVDLGWWIDHPSLRKTPEGYAWDLHHRGAFVPACRPTQEIKNVYGGRGWSDAQLGPMSNETAWLASTKDDSAIVWAETNLTAGARGASPGNLLPWKCQGCGQLNLQKAITCVRCRAVDRSDR